MRIDMVKVSVIVPVFNARDYVIPCVESLLGQSMDDIEVIFVDDHGTDGSIDAIRSHLEGYSGKKEFVFLATTVNGGPGVARNLGIEAARGEYVAFVDSDDWVEMNFCELLYKAASKKSADLSYCDIRMENQRDGSSEELHNPDVSSGEFTEKKHRYFLSRYVSYFTTFLYRREFLAENAIRFPQTRSSEDSCFLASCLLSARRIASVGKPLYHYVKRRSSLSTKTDPERYKQKLTSFDDLIGYARRHDLYELYKPELDFMYIKKAYLMAAVTYVENAVKPTKDTLKEIQAALEERIPDYKSNSYFRKSLKVKWLSGLVAKCPALALPVLKRRASSKS